MEKTRTGLALAGALAILPVGLPGVPLFAFIALHTTNQVSLPLGCVWLKAPPVRAMQLTFPVHCASSSH